MSLVSRIGIKWVALAAIAGMLFAVSLANAQPPNEMSVTGPAAAQAIGVPFNAEVSVSDGTIPYDTYMYELDWNVADLAPAGAVDQSPAQGAGYTLSQAPSPIPGGVVSGGASATGPISYTGPVEEVPLACLTPGVHPLTLKVFSTPPPAGTSTLDSTQANPVIPTALVNGTVTCEYQADLSITKAGPASAIAGTTITYVLNMTNKGPNPAPAPIIADMVPPEKIVVGTNGVGGTPSTVPFPAGVVSTVDGAPDPTRCFWFASFTYPGLGTFANVVLCDYGALLLPHPPVGPPVMLMPVGDGPAQNIQVAIQVTIPLSDEGKNNVNVAFSGDLVATDPDPSDIGCAGLPVPPSPDNSIACLVTHVSAADMTIAKTELSPTPPVVAGATITWQVVATCAASGSPCANAAGTAGPVITDTVGAEQSGTTITAVSGGACAEGAPPIVGSVCSVTAPMTPGTSVTLTLTALVDPNLAGSQDCTNAATVVWGEPKSATGNAAVACNPASTFVGIDKGVSAYKVPVVLTVGQSATVTVTEQIEVQATGVLPISGHTWSAGVTGAGVGVDWQQITGDTDANGDTPTVDDVLTFDKDWDATPPGLYTISRNITVACTAPDAGGATVALSLAFREQGGVTVTSTGSFQVYCVGAPAQVKSPSSAVLWIMRHPNCLNPVTGEYDVGPCANSPIGWLKIDELGTNVTDVDSPNDADTFPEGMGAFEFQIKFDEKIFDLEIVPGPFLGSTGRTPICNMTVVTENWILFGCVSTGDPNAGPANAGPVTLATINVYPKNDLYLRMRPTKDNGIVRTLIDENCEWADTYGTPLPGMVDGGHVPVCGSATITIRMLEGDLNLDCNVDVLDDQAIAFRYGSSFGLLLYDPWYDLEPMTGDFDVDIKDLQFVFGRNGSTCTNPIPSGQGPMAPPPGGDPPLPPR